MYAFLLVVFLFAVTPRIESNDVRHREFAQVRVSRIHIALVKNWRSWLNREPPTVEMMLTDETGRIWLQDLPDPLDPWGNPYEIRSDGTLRSLEVISWGPDAMPDTEDDISSNR